jgi:uncharacterized membrane protein HdeD (DUF308 family)
MLPNSSLGDRPLLQAYTRTWWTVLIRGILAVVFGILALILPGAVLLTLVLIFGVFMLVDGMLALVAAFRAAEHRRHFGLLLVEGILGILAGVIAIWHPGIAATALVIVIAFWAVIGGIVEIVQAIEMRRQVSNELLLILGGLLSVAFGVVLFLSPLYGALALVWIVGVYALFFGFALIGLSFRLRTLHQHLLSKNAPRMG